MKCFVASAIERPDVDTIYDRCIRPTLRRLSIKPLRVDRVEHNEDIDNKIFELLDAADMAIVDLTYARPSVYYEAGYASGTGKPVIYIARSDHFRARDDDPEGLVRVHFDLQMKNIVRWSTPNDAFSNRLEKRLRYVLKPLLRQCEEEARLKNARAEFATLPQRSQLALLTAKTAALVRARGFRIREPQDGTGLQPGAPLAASLVAYRALQDRRQEIAVISTPSAVKRLFEMIEHRGSMEVDFSRRSEPAEVHYLVLSLKAVPRTRVASALSSFRSLDVSTFHEKHAYDTRPTVHVFVHVISGVRSESEFADTLRSKLREYDLDRGA